MSANACLDWLMKPHWCWMKSPPYTNRNLEFSQCKWRSLDWWFTRWCRDVRHCQSRSLGKAGTQQPQAGAEGAREAPPTERGFPFLSANRKTGTFLSIEEGKAWEDRLCFLLWALIASKSLGTNDAVLSSFFPTLQCTVAIINPVIHDSNLQWLPWATHLLFKKRDAKHCPKGYAHTIAMGKKEKYNAFSFSCP